MKYTNKGNLAFAAGAVGKDMVYALASGYVLYYYQDIMGLSASLVGIVLLIARVFDAVNDPAMGVIVAKTNTRFGRFRPWLLTGSVLNTFVLYALFAAPDLEKGLLLVYFAVIYVLWGETYSVMDIPYWSMIPAAAENEREVEDLSIVGRAGASIGSAVIQVGTVLAVAALGGGNEREGFRKFALIIAVLFLVAEIICFLFVKEKRKSDVETVRIRDMISALFHNDQALVVIVSIVLVNVSFYLTGNLVIYFFKYDISGPSWQTGLTVFAAVGGTFGFLGMTVLYPLLRRKAVNARIFLGALLASIAGYIILLAEAFLVHQNELAALMLPAAAIFTANGILTVLTTIFLSDSVDYGEEKTGHREESILFSMQTFVVKAASGVSVFIAGVGLDLIGLVGNTDTTGKVVAQSVSTLAGLRLLMTLIPVFILTLALIIFKAKFRLGRHIDK